MNRSTGLFALVALAIAIAACSQGVDRLGDASSAPQTASSSLAETGSPSSPVPSASPTSSPIGTLAPTEPATDPANVFAANGIGPYVIGSAISELQADGLITNIEPSANCDDEWEHANATGRYADQLSVTFHLGRLIDVSTISTEFVTPSGARVGTPLTELQSIYGSQGTLITGVSGNQAVSVRVPGSDLGIVFYLDEANTKILSMSAGGVERLERAAVVGEGC